MSYGTNNGQWRELSIEQVFNDGHHDGAVHAVTVQAPNGQQFFKLCRAYEPANAPGKLFTSNKPVMVRLENRDSLLAAIATFYAKVARVNTDTAVGAALNKAVKTRKAKLKMATDSYVDGLKARAATV